MIRDGRYRAETREIVVDLRIDHDVCGVISGDVFRRERDAEHYVASFRTPPGQPIARDAREWAIVGQDEQGRTAGGRLSVEVGQGDEARLTGSLVFDSGLHGLPSRRAIAFDARRVAAALRRVGIETEREADVEPPEDHDVDGRSMSVEAVFRRAGIETYPLDGDSIIPSDKVPSNGWESAQLYTLMHDLAHASLARRAWEVHLLVLSKSSPASVFGVMFDKNAWLPRQGAAVFAKTIRELRPNDHVRKVLQTTVHELGHAVNLAHRFERAVGHGDSLSIMNYDWRYRGGGRANDFWDDFTFTFDPDELEFLRHAPLPALIPGGAPFHSASYWADGHPGFPPVVPEEGIGGVTLKLEPPGTGALFAFAQPVFLSVTLANVDAPPFAFAMSSLDPKSGFLEVLIKRRTIGAAPGLVGASTFAPVVRRCFDLVGGDVIEMRPGSSYEENLNLAFGSRGFAFSEPGTYEVTALLSLTDPQRQRDYVVRSNTVLVRIAAPRNAAEEREALKLFEDDIGLYIALGGADVLDVDGVVSEVIDRRTSDNPDDPIVAALVRAQALDSSRAYVRCRRGRTFERREPKYEKAAALFDRLRKGNALAAFDKSTAARTAKLATEYTSRFAPRGR